MTAWTLTSLYEFEFVQVVVGKGGPWLPEHLLSGLQLAPETTDRTLTSLWEFMQVVVGKGGPWLPEHLLSGLQLAPETTAIIGDRLDTDVALGLQAGFQTVVPLTGVCTRAQAEGGYGGFLPPDFVVDSLASLR